MVWLVWLHGMASRGRMVWLHGMASRCRMVWLHGMASRGRMVWLAGCPEYALTAAGAGDMHPGKNCRGAAAMMRQPSTAAGKVCSRSGLDLSVSTAFFLRV